MTDDQTDDQEVWLNRSRAIVSAMRRKLKDEPAESSHLRLDITGAENVKIDDVKALTLIVWLVAWAELVQNQLEALTEALQDDEDESEI